MMKGKKGADNTSVTGMLGAIILVAILVFIVGYFVWDLGGNVNKYAGTVKPALLDAKYVAGCANYYSPSFKSSFCDKFDSIDVQGVGGLPGYVSCQYPKLVERLWDDGKMNVVEGEAQSEINDFCGGDVKNLAKEECDKLKTDEGIGFEGVWINGIVFDENCDTVEEVEQETLVAGGN